MNRPSSAAPATSVLRVEHVELEAKNGLITVCAWCDRVRDTRNHWHSIDAEALHCAGVNFTHTICSDCKTECLKQVAAPVPVAPRLNFGLA